ncbi:NAD(P)-dependent oxidoreductase [Pseudonocardia asaccharolytica]|uniref:NAD(P)-dependent oxidoreductase n=1 Tax=Pseudonocardia asaccharolytica TaxID=54010 RepID=UPI00040A102B|nr:NAD(P)-dependent oxidoreductase [Pseudonocardia asaccharolytica]
MNAGAGSARRIGLLHPGQMGAAVAAQARRTGAEVLWCAAGRSPASRDRADAAGLTAVAELAELLDRCATVLSICPPAAAEELASSVADHGFAGLFVEANAISVERAERIMQRMARSGTRVVDAAIFGPLPRDERSANLYLAGAAADLAEVAELFRGTSVAVIPTEGAPGSASALKMAHTSYQKTARALAAVAHALAAGHGVTAHLLTEARRNSASPLAEPERLTGVAARAWRWAPELAEAADTLAAQGLPADLARAAVPVLDRWAQRRDAWDLPLEIVLDDLGTGQPEDRARRP